MFYAGTVYFSGLDAPYFEGLPNMSQNSERNVTLRQTQILREDYWHHIEVPPGERQPV